MILEFNVLMKPAAQKSQKVIRSLYVLAVRQLLPVQAFHFQD